MPAEFLCTIDGASAGSNNLQPPFNSVAQVVLTDTQGSFTKTVFQAVDEVKREILAVALAAISNQAQVLAILDPPTAGATWLCYMLQIVID